MLKLEVPNIVDARKLQCSARTIDGTAINDQDLFGSLRNGDKMFYAPSNAGQAGHLSGALVIEPPRNTVSQFASIRTSGA